MADPVAKKLNTYEPDYNSPETRSNEGGGESPSRPIMKQGTNSSGTSTSSAYRQSMRNIQDDVNTEIENTRKLNGGKEELWAKFAENTEVTVVTRLDSLSSTEIGELSKWFREKAKPQITTLSISNSDIDDKAAIALAKVIKPQSNLNKLTTLQIGHKLSKLATLELVGNKISDEGIKTLVKAVSSNHTITSLKLNKSNIGDEGLDALVELIDKNNNLRTLNLQDTNLTSDQKKRLTDAEFANSNSKIENVYY